MLITQRIRNQLMFAFSLVFLLSVSGRLAFASQDVPTVADPRQFQWTYHPVSAQTPEAYYSGTMEIGEATFTIGGETLTTRAYRQAGASYTIPGPTMTVVPGNKYVLRFHNTLPYEAPSSEHNVFKDPNISNLHTHGLHISGESPGDDVTRSFEGGYGGDFVYDIPDDHMGGTYWYHAHHHGSTFLQVSGGAFGMLLVDDSADGVPDNVAAMTERQIVLGFLDPGAAGTGGDTLISGTLTPSWTVNGLVGGTISIPPDTWQHWRVLVADRNAMEKVIEFGPECEVMLLARDGVWRTITPKELATKSISLTGASRADFAIRTSSPSTLMVDGNVVATIQTEGVPDSSVHPFDADGVSTWSAIRPGYLRDLRNELDVNFEAVTMGARTINGSKFDKYVPTFTLPALQVQEWSVNGANRHPFHLHVYHVQMLADVNDYEAGEYYDVVASNASIRFDLSAATGSPYDGRTIMHCHILEHEDRGAMGWLDVIGGEPRPTFPIDGDIPSPYGEYYSLGSGPSIPDAPTDLVAGAVSSSRIDLAWTDASSNEEGFDIERSIDGLSFNYLNSVGPNVTSYSDGGLPAETTYTYRVSAYNAAGSSDPSNLASATTLPGQDPTSVTVGSIVTSAVGIGQGFKIGEAVVTIVDDQGGPVANAVVSGYFSGSFDEPIASSLETDEAGRTVIHTQGSAKGNVAVTFCVTFVYHPVLEEFIADPGTVCGSN